MVIKKMCGELKMFFFFFKQKTAYEIGTGDWSSDGVLFRSKSGGAAAARNGQYKKRECCRNENWAV